MRLHRLVVSALSVCGMLLAQDVPQVKKTTVTATSPASGKEMYLDYCATCHGKDGKGNGPAAVALKVAPTNLTTPTARNSGKFPDVRIARLIDGSDDLTARDAGREPDRFSEVDPRKMR